MRTESQKRLERNNTRRFIPSFGRFHAAKRDANRTRNPNMCSVGCALCVCGCRRFTCTRTDFVFVEQNIGTENPFVHVVAPLARQCEWVSMPWCCINCLRTAISSVLASLSYCLVCARRLRVSVCGAKEEEHRSRNSGSGTRPSVRRKERRAFEFVCIAEMCL